MRTEYNSGIEEEEGEKGLWHPIRRIAEENTGDEEEEDRS